MQEAAQLLSGPHYGRIVLESLLGKIRPQSIQSVILVNATPYDAWLERTALRWGSDHGYPMDYLSVSMVPSLVEFVEKKIGIELLEAGLNSNDHQTVRPNAKLTFNFCAHKQPSLC